MPGAPLKGARSVADSGAPRPPATAPAAAAKARAPDDDDCMPPSEPGSVTASLRAAAWRAVHGPPLSGAAHDRLTRRQFAWCTAATWISSTTSGALNMLLLLASFKAGHSVMQTAVIFAAFQGAGALGSIVAGNLMAVHGLRTVLTASLVLQTVAQALFLPLRHSHSDTYPVPAMSLAVATAYGSCIQFLNGLARVVARLASKTLPRLAEPPTAKAAGGSERGLLLKSAIVTGGRTAVRGSGFLIGGLMLQYLG